MKIEYLYHASCNKEIEVLKPSAESIRDPNEGPVVFATQEKAYASCFLVPSDDSWSIKSWYVNTLEHPTLFVVCISDEKRFKDLDKGGVIYYLSPKDFYLDESKSKIEWTSKEEVRPIKKDMYSSGLDAMIENGVIVYFCDEETFLSLKKDPEDVHRTMDILKSLVSENEKRGLENIIHKYY